MKLFKTQIELQAYLTLLRKQSQSIGFVPTMGALHDGHIQLVKASIQENDLTVVSIFINKKQFNNLEDYNNYPQNLSNDMQLLERVGCDVLFMPDHDEMYPKTYVPINLDLGHLNTVLEGPNRPGHFDGVVQVVNRLFNYVMPNKAYFGLKDYQQCMVIKVLQEAYFPQIDLEFCDTVRLSNGLAMSSRNLRLSKQGVDLASQLYKMLDMIKRLSQHIESKDALQYAKHLLTQKHIEVEYLTLAHADTLTLGKKWFKKHKNVVLIAAHIEGVRLIDNIVF